MKTFYRFRSPIQDIVVVETKSFGHVLAIDGEIQSAEEDEGIYHRTLTQPAKWHLADHPGGTVLILGGGEGAVIREILDETMALKIVQVDIDPAVTAISRKFMPGMSLNGAVFEDPKVYTPYGDAIEYMRECTNQFDVVISDLSSPWQDGPSARAYLPEFFRLCANVLYDKGILVFQSMIHNPQEWPHRIKPYFELKKTERIFVPSYQCMWTIMEAQKRDRKPKRNG